MLPFVYIFGLKISTYWLCMAFGFALMLILMLFRRHIFQLKVIPTILLVILLMLSGLVGGKILYILENMTEVLREGISLAGFSFFGAVFLIPIVMYVIRELFDLDRFQILDACAPCVSIMIAIIRFGCFLNGCCGGIYIKGALVRWPTQAIESIFDILIFLKLLNLENGKKLSGNLYAFFLKYYGCIRFLIEFLRDTSKNYFGLSSGQIFSIIAVLMGEGCILYRQRCWKRKNEEESI